MEALAIEQVSLKNFRCFREEQTARLAPLTLLVGENSTGKTSFMALVWTLLGLAYSLRTDSPRGSIFDSSPYDLGSYDEIAHHSGLDGRRAKTFKVGFVSKSRSDGPFDREPDQIRVDYTFGKKEAGPSPLSIRLSAADAWIDLSLQPKRSPTLSFGTSRGSWHFKADHHLLTILDQPNRVQGPFMALRWFDCLIECADDRAFLRNLIPAGGSLQPTRKDKEALDLILGLTHALSDLSRQHIATTPVRSKPRRAYNPSAFARDSEGTYLPMYLANLSFSNPKRWRVLKRNLEIFGKRSGLFDEISVRYFGETDTEPFQVQVRQLGSELKTPHRNFVDVGYGVSQVLPVVTELIREESRCVFLLQQPEIHLHPSAQAALGSFFCEVASLKHQLIVETHSDHILDRVRMDIRDKVFPIKPQDVSILYFERGGLDVSIYSLRLDQEGNVLDAPDSYRSFFMTETKRSLGL